MGCCASKRQVMAKRHKQNIPPNPQSMVPAKVVSQPNENDIKPAIEITKQSSHKKQQKSLAKEKSRLELLLAPLVQQVPSIQCPSGNRIIQICISSDCQNALRCENSLCKSCVQEIHSKCQFKSLKQLTEIINKKTQDYRNLVAQVVKIEDKYVQNIHQLQQDFVERMRNYILERMSQQTIQSISKLYLDKSSKSFNGKQALSLFQQLERKSYLHLSQKYQRLERYSLNIQQKLAQIEKLKVLCFLTDIVEIDSEILRLRDNNTVDMPFINEALGNPESFQLIYRASQHNFSAVAFHKLCDGIQDTFIFIRTQFGKTIAGFTHYKWEKNLSTGGWLDNPEKRTFLLQLDLRQKMVPMQQNKLIYYSKDDGPTFGYGADLSIGDNCNIKSNSYADFPTTYNCQAPNQYVNDQNSYKAFSGATKGSHFKVLEYQVYKVRWPQK